MSHELRPQIVAPTHPHLTRMILAGLGCAMVGGALVVAARPVPVVQEPAAAIQITETIAVPMSVPVVMRQEPPPVAATRELSLVLRAGGATYMKLASLGDDAGAEAMPRHGKAVLTEDDYVTSAVASVLDADVPLSHRQWLGKRVVVDGTCSANVTGFAVIARLTGDPGYAGIENTDNWTAASTMQHGAKLLAAKLDNCAGGTYARDAALPAILVPQEIEDAPLAAAATRAIKASAATRSAQTEWETAEQKGTWYEAEGMTTSVQVLRHPRTGTTWVSVHLYYGGGCGLPNLSVWGLYRANADGKLTQVKSSLGELITIEKLVDLDGDGELEVIGRPWLGTERAVQRIDGAGLQDLSLPFYFCPC